MKKVSIIIACYNHEKFLEKSVLSALNQTYENLEIIIANDGSNDRSLDVANKLSKLYDKVIVINHENKGVVFARNNAIKNCSGHYILPLDADDFLSSNDVIEEMVKELEKEKVDMIFGNYQCFGVENKLVSKTNSGIATLLKECYISATTLFKKECFDEIGGYSKKMKLGYEDWEFNIRFIYKFKVAKIEKTIFHYRTQELSRNTQAKEKSKYLYQQIIDNNKEAFAENFQEIISLFEDDKNKLRKKIKKQNRFKNLLIALSALFLIANFL